MRTRIRVASREKESDILRTIMDGLAAMKIWAVRMNSGAMYGSHKGKRWAVRFGRKGMGDILAIQPRLTSFSCSTVLAIPHTFEHLVPIWIEVKRPGERQTADQFDFEIEVLEQGHRYIVVHSWEEVLAALQEV